MIVQQESAVVLGAAARPGYVRMMSTRADLKQFEIKEDYIDVNREERLGFARKHAKYIDLLFVCSDCMC